ncbi:MAG TPA: PQQ-binding-like beta-propeller repeat protein [Chloroflexota bacterium]|nr:PQQ-binding-like beta-propeller repeat protein [Chloroflexota bacterium]
MRTLIFLAILGLLFPLTAGRAATPPPSDWPALNYDAGQTNDNPNESTLTASNVLKVKVLWSRPIADNSYPIVAGGRVYDPVIAGRHIHIKEYMAQTGSFVRNFSRDALGGMLMDGSTLWAAGSKLQAIDAATGATTGVVVPPSKAPHGTFLDPLIDGKYLLAGYTSTTSGTYNALYGIDPSTQEILWRQPSETAQATVVSGRAVTVEPTTSAFYDESSGKQVGKWWVRSAWFAYGKQAYTVGVAPKTKQTTLYATNPSGHWLWQRSLGPPMAGTTWPEAATSTAIYVGTYIPSEGVTAVNPKNGVTLWHRALPNIVRIVVAGKLLYALTFGPTAPVAITVFDATSGKRLGTVTLSPGYAGFYAPNCLMVANGEIFLRVVASTGSVLLALGK